MKRDISFLDDWRTFWFLVKFFRREKPSIVHLNSSKAGGLGALAARLARVPRIIFTSHGLAYDEDRQWWQQTLIFLATWATFLLSHQIILITADSFTRAQKLPWVAHKLSLIHNGIKPLPLKFSMASKKFLGISRGTFVIGVIAELTKNKGLEYLIEAIKNLQSLISNFQVLIIGEGEERATLELLSAKYSLQTNIRFLGNQEHAQRYFGIFDCFVLPSVKEGLPYVLLEAGQVGVPVLASSVGGVPDIIKDYQTGLLVRPKDPAALAHALDWIRTNREETKRFAKNLKEKIACDFSLDHMLEDTIRVYRN